MPNRQVYIMQEKYTVSELARLFGISNQTLRYYDKIGLFKPSQTDPHTGYRYYSYKQFFMLSMIIQLKRLNFSLESIQKYSSARDIKHLKQTLIEQKALIRQEIVQLQRLEERNDRLLGKLQFAEGISSQPDCELVTEPDRFQYEVPVNFEIKDLYHYIKLVYESYIRSPFATNVSTHSEIVLKINQENLEAQRFRIYNSIGFFLDECPDVNGRGVAKIRGGLYATCIHLGAYDSIHRSYQKLYDFIQTQGLSICGDSLEFAIISTSLAENPDNFITQIQIPVRQS